MMLMAIKPNGLFISDKSIQYRKEIEGKFYVFDKAYNKIEISKEDYMKLKVKEVAGLLVQTLEEMEQRNPIAKQVMDKCGDDLCGAFFGTLTTLFSLHLLARTHNTKEFNEIMKTISKDENVQA